MAIELVSQILGSTEVYLDKGIFDWLRGDKGTKLRVDAYFPNEKLVVEYNGVQHYRHNALMDRREGRAEQRRRYSDKRRKLIPKNGLKLLEIRYDEPLTEEHIRHRLLEEGIKF